MFDKDAIKQLTQAESITAANSSMKAGEVGAAMVALPAEFTVHDLEKTLELRRRARGTMTTSSIDDFATYVAAHVEDGASTFVHDDMAAVAILNLGTPEAPGHADNRAKLTLKPTAAYLALKRTANGSPLTQTKAAEFMEDWPGQIRCFNDAGEVTPPRAIAAVRKVTIEALKKLENVEQQLGASRSAFESVQATSTEPLPTMIYFNCIPYHGLEPRDFVLRLGVQTGAATPAITLRIINQEEHDEEMAEELAGKVRAAIDGKTPVLIGQYTPGS